MLTKKDIGALVVNDSLVLAFDTNGKEYDGYMTVENARLVASRAVKSMVDPNDPWAVAADQEEIKKHEVPVEVKIHTPTRKEKGKQYVGISPAMSHEILVDNVEVVWATMLRQVHVGGYIGFVLTVSGTKAKRGDALFGEFTAKTSGEGKRGRKTRPYTYMLDVTDQLMPVEWYEVEEQQEAATA